MKTNVWSLSLIFTTLFCCGASFSCAYATANKKFPWQDVVPRDLWQGTLYAKPGDENYWYPEYAHISRIVIHHTAEREGIHQTGQYNSSLLINDILRHHAQKENLRDIGYNYIVDYNGLIYEGREGGDNVVGSHTKNWDKGALGIALMGNYTTNDLSQVQREALVRFLSMKSIQYNLNPQGATIVIGEDGKKKTVPVIASYRDYVDEKGSGSYLEAFLPDLRNKVADTIAPFKAEKSNQLVGKIWRNPYFNGSPQAFVKTTFPLSFSPGAEVPVKGIDSLQYSVRWDGVVGYKQSSYYRFSLIATNRARLWIDGMLAIDAWEFSREKKRFEKMIYLDAGLHDVRVDYSNTSSPSHLKIDMEEVPLPEYAYIVEYYNNPYFAGLPSYTDFVDDVLFPPVKPLFKEVSSKHFSALWRGNFTFPSEWYTFVADIDGGIRVRVGDTVVVDALTTIYPGIYWKAVPRCLLIPIPSAPSNYKIPVMVEYTSKQAKQPSLTFSWLNERRQLSPTPGPSPVPTRDSGHGDVKAEFFNNHRLLGEPDVVYYYDAIDFDWGTKAPHPVIFPDTYSIRFTQPLLITEDNAYSFFVSANEGVRLRIDDEVLLDYWDTPLTSPITTTVRLHPGAYTLVLEYYEDEGPAHCKLSWGISSHGKATLLKLFPDHLVNFKELSFPSHERGFKDYEAAWVGQTQAIRVKDVEEGYFLVKPGETVEVIARFLNRGLLPWKRDGEEEITVAVYKDPKVQSGPAGSCYSEKNPHCSGIGKYGESYFYHPDWCTKHRLATLIEETVLPGEVGTFYLKFRIPNDAPPGKYREDITLAHGSEWMDNTINGDEIGKAHIWVGFIVR